MSDGRKVTVDDPVEPDNVPLHICLSNITARISLAGMPRSREFLQMFVIRTGTPKILLNDDTWQTTDSLCN